jgi:hypothetical protein
MANVGSDFHSGGTVVITGLKELQAKLRAADADMSQMNELMHSLGLIVIAHTRVPSDSGELASSLRAGKGRTKAVVRAGYARRAGYAGVVHYGDPHRGHKPQPFLTDALKRSQAQVVNALSDGIGDILKKNNLT